MKKPLFEDPPKEVKALLSEGWSIFWESETAIALNKGTQRKLWDKSKKQFISHISGKG